MTAKRELRAILFDAVGTLLRPAPGVAAVYADVGRQFGCAPGEREIAARFARAFARQEQIDRRCFRGRTSEPRERDRWQRIVRRVFGRSAALEPIFAALWDHFGRPQSWQLDPAIGPLWQELSARGFQLGLASNFDRRLLTICAAQPELADCPRVFVSSLVGWKKPSGEFFRAVERQLGLAGAQILLVGDDVGNDYQAALAAGWQALLLDPAGRWPALDAIARLDQLPARLG
ncbi:MAG TPA: HAD-IA family hydrolase [Pirellulales bacterium]|nr:HAD-IA family hydrolase [Pirellulales bacterium]